MRPCSESPTLDEAPVDELDASYTFIQVLGKGSEGLVVEVQDEKHRRLAVKIVPLTTQSIQEVNTQCLLTDLNKKTKIFAHAYGWQVHASIPLQWKQFLKQEEVEEGTLLFIFMEKTIENWTNSDKLRIQSMERKAIVFLILHGLYWARKELEFDHSDLHDENIMLQMNTSQNPLKLKIDENEFVLPGDIRFIPKLIDFGFSTTKFTVKDEEEEEASSEDDIFGGSSAGSTDVSSLVFAFPEIAKIMELAQNSDASDFEVLEEVLLSNYFSEFRRICKVCGSVARFISTNQTLYCSTECFEFAPYEHMVTWEWKDHKGDPQFVEFRKKFVDWLLAKVVRDVGCEGLCTVESVGSTTLYSDYDLTVSGPKSAEIVDLFNAEFRKIFGKESATVFDTNVYGAAFVEKIQVGNFTLFGNGFKYVADANDVQNQREWALLKVYRFKNPKPNWPAIKEKQRLLGDFKTLKNRNLLYVDSLYGVKRLKKEMMAKKSPDIPLRQAYKEFISTANYYGAELYYTQGAYMHVVGQIQSGVNDIPITREEYMDSFIENIGDTLKEVEHGAVAFSKYLSRAMEALLHIKEDAYIRNLYEACEALRTKVRGRQLCNGECVLDKDRTYYLDRVNELLYNRPEQSIWKVFLENADI